MSQDALISVIIPVHRRLQYVEHAINSALGQTHPRVEVIVVDDGSPVDPGPVVARFGDRIRLIRKPNGGLASARNCGVAAASGEYLVFLDDDDFYEHDALETLLSALLADNDAAWAAGKFAYVDSTGTPLPKKHACTYQSGDVYERMIFNNLMGAPSVVLLRADAFKDASGFDESFILSEDWDFWLTLAKCHPLVAVEKRVSNYRVHGEQISQTQWERHFEFHLRLLKKHQTMCRPGTSELFNRGIAKLHLQYADKLYMAGDHRAARVHWRKAASMDRTNARVLGWRMTKSYLPGRAAKVLRSFTKRLKSWEPARTASA